MGKYSKVKASNLLNNVNTALSEIAKYNLSNIEFDLNSTNNLNTSAGNNILTSLYQISDSKKINGSIPILERALKNLKSAAEYMLKCQTLEKEIAKLEQEKYSYDRDGNKSVSSWVVWSINNKKRTLSSYENKIDTLLS